MKQRWVEPDLRDEVVDFIKHWHERTRFPLQKLLRWLKLQPSKYYAWVTRYGKVNEHNGKIPRDHWLTDEEKSQIIDYYAEHPDSGYRRLTYMMMDADVVAMSPASVYRVLKAEGLMKRFAGRVGNGKGKGFEQPLSVHKHWHLDISCINICGTFYYLCTILDGYSRFVINFGIGEAMTQSDVEIIIEQAKEKYPMAKPRIITDNGPQFIAKDFKEYIRISGMTQVRTSPYYPQSNGKIERWHQSLKTESLRQKVPLSLEDARRIIGEYIREYNQNRLHSGIGYVTPQTKMDGAEKQVWAMREAKLANARAERAKMRQLERMDEKPKTGQTQNLSLSISR
ncbi:MAG: IS3 family transposase [Acidobacteriota bacterium]|nr:IS3 family transposase [Acidobacteriota bacterium]